MTMQVTVNCATGGEISAPLDSAAQTALDAAQTAAVTAALLSAPTLAAGDAAGTSAPAPVLAAGSSDQAGQYTFGTGAGATAGAMVVVTFAAPRSPHIQVTGAPLNAATAVLAPYLTQTRDGNGWVTGLICGFALAPAADQPADTYAVNYRAG